MARARNIKPAFFQNEELVELSFSTRLLFIGLWTLADREGRMEDRPKRIKMALFPTDDLDIELALCELESTGFIVRYEHEESKYIQVVSFCKHQNPHRDEKASIIPAQYNNDSSTVQAQCKDDANSVAIGLIPDSLNLIPDSLIDKCTEKKSIVADATAPLAKPPKKEKVGLSVDDLVAMSVDKQVAVDWFAVRKDKRQQTLTRTALQTVESEALAAGLTLNDAIRVAVGSGWAGFKSSWYANSQATGSNAGNQRASPVSRAQALEDANRKVIEDMANERRLQNAG